MKSDGSTVVSRTIRRRGSLRRRRRGRWVGKLMGARITKPERRVRRYATSAQHRVHFGGEAPLAVDHQRWEYGHLGRGAFYRGQKHQPGWPLRPRVDEADPLRLEKLGSERGDEFAE